MGWLKDDVALITGGGSGLGRALVERFLEEGAQVSVLEWSAEKAEALKRDFDGKVVVTVGDVRSLEDNRKAFAATLERFGKLDILVGNAGIQDGGGSFLDLPAEKLNDGFSEVMGVNVQGYILAAHVTARELVRTRGCMVFTASSASFIPGGGGIFYTTSKHAVVGVVRELAYQLAPAVRVNAVAPGPMRTDLRGSTALGGQDIVFSPQIEEIERACAEKFPLSCMDPADYAGLFVALASRKNAATTTGEVINAADGVAIRGHMSVTAGIVQ